LSNCAEDGKGETAAQQYPLRVRSRKGSDEQRVYFEVIVAEREDGIKIIYRPHGPRRRRGAAR
jgi:hypothetical protein